MRDHTKLNAFHAADGLAVAVYKATRGFPREEQFGLTSQVRRAAVSVPSNIVEGCARSSEADYRRFLDLAFGSLRELTYQAGLAQRLGFMDAISFRNVDAMCTSASKLLAALIRSLRPRSGSPPRGAATMFAIASA